MEDSPPHPQPLSSTYCTAGLLTRSRKWMSKERREPSELVRTKCQGLCRLGLGRILRAHRPVPAFSLPRGLTRADRPMPLSRVLTHPRIAPGTNAPACFQSCHALFPFPWGVDPVPWPHLRILYSQGPLGTPASVTNGRCSSAPRIPLRAMGLGSWAPGSDLLLCRSGVAP